LFDAHIIEQTTFKIIIMAVDNMISLSFTNEELQTIGSQLATIEGVTSNKLINLTPDERKSYSQVSDKTEDWIGRVKTYMAQSPTLVLWYIDVVNTMPTTMRGRQFCLERKLISVKKSNDTCMLLGADLYHNAIVYYKGLKGEAATDAPDAKTIYADLSSRFPGHPVSVSKNA
jgi:hypothetical protein